MGNSPSTGSILLIVLVALYFLLPFFGLSWVNRAEGYEIGNRKRFISVLKLEILMLLFNIFIYDQLMAYFSVDEENKISKCEKRRIAISRQRFSLALLIFMFFAQMIYFMYYAPEWLQWLLFDITTICAGLWTNLLGFVSGFYLVNLLIGPLNRFGPFRFLISSLSELKFVYNILYDRKSQVKFSFTATLIMSFLMWYGCDKVVVKEIILPVQNLSVTSGSLKLAVVSDIHAGASVYREQVSKVVDKILGLDVDAVTIVGDMVDGPVSSLKDRVDPFWQVSRRFPTYFVTGNHEYYYGNVMEWIDLYRQNGINVLQNSHTVLRGICLAGVNDISSGKMGIKDHYMNVSVAFSDCPKGATRILLSHNPASVKDISEDDLQTIDLILSGHTHAGQFYVVFPVIYWILPYYYGLYDLPYGKLMVSAGTLYQGPPMKMLRMSEIWIVTLTKA